MKKPLLFTLCLGTLGSPLFVAAQDAEGDAGPVFELSPFVVDSQDQRGYVATTSMSGTRLNQMVKDVPIPIDIITEDFIRDTGALTIEDALQYTAGLQTNITSQQVGENPSTTGTSFRLRGFVSQAALRNGFRREGTSDTINVSQVDVVRGPNALLYGIGNFGGVVNYVTKTPLEHYRAEVRLTLGRWDLYRAELDVTGPVTEKLGFRIPMLYHENKGWTQYAEQRKRGIAPIFEYRFTPKTSLQVEFDYYEKENTASESPLSKSTRSEEKLGFVDGTYHPGDQGFLEYPNRSFRYIGPNTNRTQEDRGVLAQLTHTFSEILAGKIGVYLTETEVTSQGASLQLKPIPSILSGDRLGEINRERFPWAFNPLHEKYDEWSAEDFYALEYNWNRSESVRERDQARFELTYQPDWFGIEHSFMFGATYDELAEQTTPWELKDQEREPTSLSKNDYTGLQGARPRYHSIYNFDPIPYDIGETEEFLQTADPLRNFIGESIGSYLIHQAKFFDNRVRTITGLRYDRFQVTREQRYEAEESIDEVGDLSLVGQRKPTLSEQNPTTEWNYSLGLSFDPMEDVSVFVLTASALDPETTGGQRVPTGFVPDPQSGQSVELGAKIDMLEGKISGSFSLYKVERENVVVSAAVLNQNELLGASETDQWEEEGRGNPGGKALREDRSGGFDAQIFLTDLIPNLQTIVSFSYNSYEIQDQIYPVYQGRDGEGNFVFENVSARENVGTELFSSLPWNDDRLNNDTPEYTAKIWNKYTFTESILEGMDIGIGVRWQDKREASFGFDDDVSYKIIPDRTVVDFMLGYVAEIKGMEFRFRLNISNMLDDDTVYGYSYTTPRQWRLTTSFHF